MLSFRYFIEDGSGVGGMAGGAPTNSTMGVSGAGDNPSGTVPVSKRIQKRIQNNALIGKYMMLSRKTI